MLRLIFRHLRLFAQAHSLRNQIASQLQKGDLDREIELREQIELQRILVASLKIQLSVKTDELNKALAIQASLRCKPAVSTNEANATALFDLRLAYAALQRDIASKDELLRTLSASYSGEAIR